MVLSMGVNQSTSRLGHLQMEAALRLLTGVTDALRGVRVYPFHHDHAVAPSQQQSGSRVECPSSGVHFDGCIFGETNDTPTVFNRGSQSITVNLTQTFHLDSPILCGDLGVVALPGLHPGLQNVLNKTMGNPGNGDGGSGGGNGGDSHHRHDPDPKKDHPDNTHKKRHIERECEHPENPAKRRPTPVEERTHGSVVQNSHVEDEETEPPSLFSDSDTVEMMGTEPTPPSSASNDEINQHAS